MRDISLHLMDIAENSISAGANQIQIVIDETYGNRFLFFSVTDNGRGISKIMMPRVTDPFVTSSINKKTGLGLSLLKASAERCEGSLSIESAPGVTTVEALFSLNHMDLPPMGDMAASIAVLTTGFPDHGFSYKHIVNEKRFIFDTKNLKNTPDHLSISNTSILNPVKEYIRNGIKHLKRF